MHILWILNTPHVNELNLFTQQYPEAKHSLLYNPNLTLDPNFLKAFYQAFPNVLPTIQIQAINPDITFTLPITIQSIEKQLLNVTPTFKEDPQPPLEVGILIRTKNSADIIHQTLKALDSQKNCRYGLVVVDSGSTDNTLAILKTTKAKIISIPPYDYIPGKVLNEGIAPFKQEIVVLLNSDAVLLTPHSLYNLVNSLSSKNTAAAFARQVPRPEAEPWVKRDYSVAFPDNRENPEWQPFSNCFSAIRKKIWEKRPFYTLAWGSEDAEWGNWVKSEGYTIAYVPDALVMHSHNYTFKQLYGRRFIEGEADAFIYKKTYGVHSLIFDWIKSCCRDLIFSLRHGHLLSILEIPFRRGIYYWAYFKGSRLGHNRLINNNLDISIGQKTVLSRHDSAEKK